MKSSNIRQVPKSVAEPDSKMAKDRAYLTAHTEPAGPDRNALAQKYLTVLIRNTPLLGPYSRTIRRVIWWS